MPKRNLWRYAVGSKTVNRVTVYERPDSPNLYVEWYDDDGRHQESLRSATGKPVTDRKLAMEIAEHMAKRQEQTRNAESSELIFGKRRPHTLAELLERLHEGKGTRWRPSYRSSQDRFRAFWLAKLGDGFQIAGWSAQQVERVVAAAAAENKWSARTEGSYLRYLVDAASFAQHKLKWITEGDNLSAVEIPDPSSEGIPYSEEEVRRLLPALRAVDPRAGLVGDAYWQAGRRLTATRMLRVADVRMEGEFAVLFYAKGTDKAKKKGEVALAGLAVDNLRRLMDTPAVKASGLLCPDGSLDDPKAKRKVVHKYRFAASWVPEAEKRAGIPHVHGRGLHGIKRTFATEAVDQDAAALQSGTTKQILQSVYRHAKLEPKKKLALSMAAVVDSERDPD